MLVLQTIEQIVPRFSPLTCDEYKKKSYGMQNSNFRKPVYHEIVKEKRIPYIPKSETKLKSVLSYDMLLFYALEIF